MIAIGQIRKAYTLYYDKELGKNSIKFRPVLILAKADEKDYVVLPISRITNQRNRDNRYDIKITPDEYPLLNLKDVSYVRTHKQLMINSADIGDVISDIKSIYEDLYIDILQRRDEFNDVINEQALA